MRWVRANIGADGSDFYRHVFGLSFLPAIPTDAQKETARRYEDWIQSLVNTISRAVSGWWILSEIASSSHNVIVKPWVPDKRKTDAENKPRLPYGDPTSYPDSSPAGKATGKPVDHPLGPNEMPPRPDFAGTGHGSDFVIRFTPWWFIQHPAGPAYDPDELLLHELVHAMNSAKGVLRLSGGAPGLFDNLEEFCAILMTNIYSAQTHRNLRRDHDGHQLLPQALCNDQAFYTKYADYVDSVYKYHPQLAAVYKFWGTDKAFLPFNPFTYAKASRLPDE
jgi:hypothetical protein